MNNCCCCCCLVTKSYPTLCDPINCSTSGFPVLHYLLEFAQTHVHWIGDAIQPSYPLSPPSPPAFIFPSVRVFSNESALHNSWPKYWSFSFSISSSNEYLGLISFRIDWFDLLGVQGTLKSLLQHHNSRASVIRERQIKTTDTISQPSALQKFLICNTGIQSKRTQSLLEAV